MSTIKDASYPITLDKERRLYYSLNAVDEMQDKFGGIDKLGEALSGKTQLKNLVWVITLGLNEGAALEQFLKSGSTEGAEILPERTVALLVNTGNMSEIQGAFYKAFRTAGSGKAELSPDEIEDAKNLKAGKPT